MFYTGSIRLLAECISLFGSGEKLAWLANHAPQEGGRLAPPDGKAPKSSVGKSLPLPEVRGRCRELLGLGVPVAPGLGCLLACLAAFGLCMQPAKNAWVPQCIIDCIDLGFMTASDPPYLVA